MVFLDNEKELWKVFVSAVQHQFSAFSQWDWKNSLHHYIVRLTIFILNKIYAELNVLIQFKRKKNFSRYWKNFLSMVDVGKLLEPVSEKGLDYR